MYLVFAVACCYSRTWLSARISMHLSKLCTYPKLGIMQIGNVDLNYGYKRLLAVFVAPALLAALQFSPASDKRKATRNAPIVQLRSLTKAGATSTEIGVSN
ncbi:hypothetical protein T05_2891 [Trichinella murrelli]|uniref:Uncharacterized protein n=1 Tax=Trichinella murrelli TaxID=144512 RepID=A0A0V0U488_9BILA|nr:hypothetical protein T05_2891 [Trichinella murrelli]